MHFYRKLLRLSKLEAEIIEPVKMSDSFCIRNLIVGIISLLVSIFLDLKLFSSFLKILGLFFFNLCMDPFVETKLPGISNLL